MRNLSTTVSIIALGALLVSTPVYASVTLYDTCNKQQKADIDALQQKLSAAQTTLSIHESILAKAVDKVVSEKKMRAFYVQYKNYQKVKEIDANMQADLNSIEIWTKGVQSDQRDIADLMSQIDKIKHTVCTPTPTVTPVTNNPTGTPTPTVQPPMPPVKNNPTTSPTPTVQPPMPPVKNNPTISPTPTIQPPMPPVKSVPTPTPMK